MAALAAAAKPLRPTPAIPASPPVLVSIPRSISGTGDLGRAIGGGGCCRIDTGGTGTGTDDDGKGTVPGAGRGAIELLRGGRATDPAADADAGEDGRPSRDGRGGSKEGRGLSNEGREAEFADGVRVRSNEGRAWIFGGKVGLDPTLRLGSEGVGGGGCWGGGGGFSLRANEAALGRPTTGCGWGPASPNGLGKGAPRVGDIGPGLDGVLILSSTGGVPFLAGVGIRSGADWIGGLPRLTKMEEYALLQMAAAYRERLSEGSGEEYLISIRGFGVVEGKKTRGRLRRAYVVAELCQRDRLATIRAFYGRKELGYSRSLVLGLDASNLGHRKERACWLTSSKGSDPI
ncbi:hypothetical protein HYDPIDRAFT_164902 [Hydnomerulius pinastri MD-312]|nr:hypothetical protein HYDPIDRAFT_164902 [Hydnomerulius pinastri MD-312]